MKSMTEISHDFLLPVLKKGAVCIDATLGQGSDSAFFLKHPVRQVIAFDIQKPLVDQADIRFADDRRFKAYCLSHEQMDQALAAEKSEGQISAVIFNFGYDPCQHGGLMTEPQSSLNAVNQALRLLRPKGRMALVFYPHEQGKEEERLIRKELLKQSGAFWQLEIRNPASDAPSLLLIEKRKEHRQD